MERLWGNARCSGYWTAQQMDAYQISLFLPENSLFFKIFSLLICVGNCSRSGCSTAVSCYEIDSQSPRIAKFPVKFPVPRLSDHPKLVAVDDAEVVGDSISKAGSGVWSCVCCGIQ